MDLLAILWILKIVAIALTVTKSVGLFSISEMEKFHNFDSEVRSRPYVSETWNQALHTNRILKNKKVAHSQQNVVCLAEAALGEIFRQKCLSWRIQMLTFPPC